ncbi:MAG: hypothetical protein AAB777_01920 [Patescibacteria group bacterium]
MRVTIFDQRGFLQKQIFDALLCPINRHFTRTEHGCDDWGLWRNPQWLVEHYINNGGAVEFAKHRAEFFLEMETPDEIEYEI